MHAVRRELVELQAQDDRRGPAKIACVDPKRLPPQFADRDFDAAFLSDLPAGVDPWRRPLW